MYFRVFLGLGWVCLVILFFTYRESSSHGDSVDVPTVLVVSDLVPINISSAFHSANSPSAVPSEGTQSPRGTRASCPTDCSTSVLDSCRHHGHPGCTWSGPRSRDCHFGMTVAGAGPMRALLNNRTIVFQGDSMLRDVFNGLLWQCCFGSLPKRLANMRRRTPQHFHFTRMGFNITLVFRFDFDAEHLAGPITEYPALRPDAVVVSVGSHMAFNTTRQAELGHGGITPSLEAAVASVAHSYGDRVPVVLLGQHMECSAMANAKVSGFRKKAKQCPAALEYIRSTNTEMESFAKLLGARHARSVHYIPPLVCTTEECTEDGMHSKKGRYSRARVDLILNLVRLLWACPYN